MSAAARVVPAVLWVALPTMTLLSAVGLRAELLAWKGLEGWDATLEEPGGDRASLRAAHDLDPARTDLSIALGLCRDLPPAQRALHLREAIGEAPAAALAWAGLGLLEAEQGDEKRALYLYRIAERLDPLGSATQIRLAALAIDLMDLGAALPRLRRAAALAPDERLIEALDLAIVVTADPNVLDGLVPPGAANHLRAGRFLEDEGLDAAAEIQYEKATAEDPRSGAIHETHVRFHLRREERSEAIRLIRARLAWAPGAQTPLRSQLVQLLLDERRGEEAAVELSAALRLDPASDELANQRAVLELEQGDASRCVEMAELLVGRRPMMAAARVTLARALWKRGDRPGAARELAQAEGLDPGRPEVQLLMARLNREIGNVREAAERYRRAIAMGYVSPAREELSTLR